MPSCRDRCMILSLFQLEILKSNTSSSRVSSWTKWLPNQNSATWILTKRSLIQKPFKLDARTLFRKQTRLLIQISARSFVLFPSRSTYYPTDSTYLDNINWSKCGKYSIFYPMFLLKFKTLPSKIKQDQHQITNRWFN